MNQLIKTMTSFKDTSPNLSKIPTHIAIIMDGNGRWAKKRGLPRLAGHRAGTENLRRIIEACVEYGVKHLTIYAFSTENWNRPQKEVSGLMNIFREVFDRELQQLHKNGAQLRHIGNPDRFDPVLRSKVEKGIALTAHNDRLILNVAFNYGGREEIVQAVRRMVADGLQPEEIDDQTISRYMYTSGQPDPDLIIRTSGEYRTSNFLIWQGAYTEWYFTEAFWPDFDEKELLKALIHFSKRERRFGMVSEQLS